MVLVADGITAATATIIVAATITAVVAVVAEIDAMTAAINQFVLKTS